MKDLLLLVHDDDGEPARIEVSVKLAALLGATVNCLDIDESRLLNDEVASYTSDGRALRQLVRGQAAGHRERLQQRLTDANTPWTWISREGDVCAALPREAGFHDLTITGTHPESLVEKNGHKIISALVVGARTPALLVPQGGGGDLLRSAVVAWNGSPPCLAALRAAVPLLALTAHVTLIQVGELEQGAPLEQAAAYLHRHGIESFLERLPANGGPSRAMLSRCRPEHVGFCVMGAFSRWRSVEATFGGTTTDMLRSSRVPLLVAH